MWSEVMGLWECMAACTWDFPQSQKVTRSVGSTVLRNFEACLPFNANTREMSTPAVGFEGVSLI